MITLRDLKPHIDATIVEFKTAEFAEQSVAIERLIELGFLPGTSVRMLTRLPFGGPLVVSVGETFVALRLDEADFIKVSVG